jgi:hypothetical protein
MYSHLENIRHIKLVLPATFFIYIEMPVSRQEIERSCICVLCVSILFIYNYGV